MSEKFQTKNSKLALQAINKFHYYAKEVIPDLSNCAKTSAVGPNCISKKGITYFHGKNRRSGEYNYNLNTVVNSIKGAYLAKRNPYEEVMKMNSFLYSKKNYLGGSIWGGKYFSELIQIRVEDNQQTDLMGVQDQKPLKIYIIHHCSQEKTQETPLINWLTFVEQITITKQQICQTIIASINGEKKFINWGCKVTLFQQLIKSYYMVDTLEGYILQFAESIVPVPKAISDPAFSQQHNVTKMIPMKFISVFHQLKKQFGEDAVKDICRFMISKEFSYQESKTALEEYFSWKFAMQLKYKWEDFADIHSRGIFTYLGEDIMGRPVILNRSNRLNIYQVDLEKYCDYYVYFLEIYVPSLMRGNVYQMVIIGDAGDNKSQNFKLSLTKRNLTDSLKYCAQRQYRLIAVNADTIAVYVYKLIKPMIPKRSQQKIMAIGCDKKQIINTLGEYINMDVIPSYLGGQNTDL